VDVVRVSIQPTTRARYKLEPRAAPPADAGKEVTRVSAPPWNPGPQGEARRGHAAAPASKRSLRRPAHSASTGTRLARVRAVRYTFRLRKCVPPARRRTRTKATIPARRCSCLANQRAGAVGARSFPGPPSRSDNLPAGRRMLRTHASCVCAVDSSLRVRDPAEPARRTAGHYRRCCSMWAFCTWMRPRSFARRRVPLEGFATPAGARSVLPAATNTRWARSADSEPLRAACGWQLRLSLRVFCRNAARPRPKRVRSFPPPPPPRGLAPRSSRRRAPSRARRVLCAPPTARPSSSAQAPPANVGSAPRMASRVPLIRRRDYRRALVPIHHASPPRVQQCSATGPGAATSPPPLRLLG
jgi:hypothetical protein